MFLIICLIMTTVLVLLTIKIKVSHYIFNGLLTILTALSLVFTVFLSVGWFFTKVLKFESEKDKITSKVQAYQHLADTSSSGVVAVLTPDFMALNNKIFEKQEVLNSVIGWYFVPDWWEEIPLIEF